MYICIYVYMYEHIHMTACGRIHRIFSHSTHIYIHIYTDIYISIQICTDV